MRQKTKDVLKITAGLILAVPVAFFLLIRETFKGGWKLAGFLFQRQYRELKRLCESGTAAELQAFLTATPGAVKYVIYTRQDRITSSVAALFRLPAPLSVAGHAGNVAVIPVLLAAGASPEVRSLSEKQTPAEEAIGDPDRMRTLCRKRTWWLDHSSNGNAMLMTAMKENNFRSILWYTLRGARLTDPEQLNHVGFLRLPVLMMEFVCRFGIEEKQRGEFRQWLKALPPEKQTAVHRFHTPFGNRSVSLKQEFAVMTGVMEKSCLPLPVVEEDAMSKVLFSSVLMSRTQMLELLNTLFTQERQFALLKHFLNTPLTPETRELTEETVDLLLCSILAKVEK